MKENLPEEAGKLSNQAKEPRHKNVLTLSERRESPLFHPAETRGIT